MEEYTIQHGKRLAILAYCTILGSLIAMSMNSENKNAFASFHIRQGFGLSVTFFLLGFLVALFDSLGVTFGFWGFFFILWLYGFIGAAQGKFHLIPLLGIFFQKFFKKL
jgi:uncharacterized membrane protein